MADDRFQPVIVPRSLLIDLITAADGMHGADFGSPTATWDRTANEARALLEEADARPADGLLAAAERWDAMSSEERLARRQRREDAKAAYRLLSQQADEAPKFGTIGMLGGALTVMGTDGTWHWVEFGPAVVPDHQQLVVKAFAAIERAGEPPMVLRIEAMESVLATLWSQLNQDEGYVEVFDRALKAAREVREQ